MPNQDQKHPPVVPGFRVKIKGGGEDGATELWLVASGGPIGVTCSWKGEGPVITFSGDRNRPSTWAVLDGPERTLGKFIALDGSTVCNRNGDDFKVHLTAESGDANWQALEPIPGTTEYRIAHRYDRQTRYLTDPPNSYQEQIQLKAAAAAATIELVPA
jgi:hypothetical protein